MHAADLAFVNGNFFTSDPKRPSVDGVAVTGSRISAVGNVGEAIGPKTEVFDLNGALLTPGFIDAHVHTATSGLDLLRVSFDGCIDASSAVAAVVAYARENPKVPWIVGSGWSQAWFERGCPDADLLDAIGDDRPVFISNRDGHSAWVNRRALERAGIAATTPDPADGRIERRADGSPQGTLHEGAMSLVERHAPVDTVEEFVDGLLKGQEVMFQFGITGWQEASVRPEVQEAYLRVAGSGDLVGDVVGALWWERERGIDQIDELVQRRQQAAPGFRPTAVKLMLDGVAENYTAAILDPYLDGRGGVTDNRGVDFIDPEELREIVVALDQLGFQCHFHALGDRAVRNGLDAIEAALAANGPSDHRHHLAHLQFVHPDDIPRFAHLAAIANAQPLWACMDEYQIELTRPFVSSDRFSWQYPFRSILHSGARLGMGSDWNVTTANVMEEVDNAITRTCLGEGPPLGPHQALTAAEALTAFTAGSAYINHVDHEAGSITQGKRADLVVFDRNPFTEGEFRDAVVAMTVVGGSIEYST